MALLSIHCYKPFIFLLLCVSQICSFNIKYHHILMPELKKNKIKKHFSKHTVYDRKHLRIMHECPNPAINV